MDRFILKLCFSTNHIQSRGLFCTLAGTLEGLPAGNRMAPEPGNYLCRLDATADWAL